MMREINHKSICKGLLCRAESRWRNFGNCESCAWFKPTDDRGHGYCDDAAIYRATAHYIEVNLPFHEKELILPCKKCGKDRGSAVRYSDNAWRMICFGCGYCTKEKETREDAIYAWNQRKAGQVIENLEAKPIRCKQANIIDVIEPDGSVTHFDYNAYENPETMSNFLERPTSDAVLKLKFEGGQVLK